MRSKLAVRSARGWARVPVTAPSPRRLPAISAGPALKGPWAVQFSARRRRPSGSIRPRAAARPAAPVSSPWFSSMRPPFSRPASCSRGCWPSTRSSSPRPVTRPRPRPSKRRDQGAPVRAEDAWIGPPKAPRAPGRMRDTSVISARPRKESPPSRLREPEPFSASAWPVASTRSSRMAPSFMRAASSCTRGWAPSRAPITPSAEPPVARMSPSMS